MPDHPRSTSTRMLHNSRPRDPGTAPTLTSRECEILHWCAVGKTSWEIARILGLSESTITFHVFNAAKKLHVRGRVAACAKALALGFLDPY